MTAHDMFSQAPYKITEKIKFIVIWMKFPM